MNNYFKIMNMKRETYLNKIYNIIEQRNKKIIT